MQNEQTPSLLQQKRPLVSFIVTTYNMPHQLLRECLESIGALGLDDDECEIVLGHPLPNSLTGRIAWSTCGSRTAV